MDGWNVIHRQREAESALSIRVGEAEWGLAGTG